MFNGIIESLKVQTNSKGKLKDLTFVAKDLLDIQGMVTGGGNPDWKRTHSPAAENCAAIQKLLDQGACLIGKTLTDELAFSLDGLNMHFPVPYNPNFKGCIPGGSSSGSASAVANGCADFALGTDTAGSIRVPAAYCGIYGLRPTYARVSTKGAIPLGTTFDTIGWMSKSLDLMNKVGSVLLNDTIVVPKMQQISLLQDGVAILDQTWQKGFMAKWHAISELCAQSGFIENRTIELTQLDEPLGLDSFGESFNHARGFEAWKAHGKWFEENNPVMDQSIKQRFLACAQINEQDYKAALNNRSKSIEQINQVLQNTFLLLPTIQKAPPRLDASSNELLENRKANILLNSLASFCGLPQISLPYQNGNNKFALSLVGPQGSDMHLLALATFIEDSGILA